MPYPYVNNYPAYMNPQNYLYPQVPAQPQNVPTPAPASQSGIVWVQGEAGAKSYLVGAGQSVLLMDSESSSFYIKSTDASGMPLPLRVFDYTERVQTPKVASASGEINLDKFVTREEFDELKASLNKLKEVKDDGE